MSLKDRVTEDMKSAMRSGDKRRLGVIRLLLAAVKQREVDERIPALDDDQVVATLDKMVKQRRESVEQFIKGGRKDLAEKESKEITIIEEYLPAAPSDAEIKHAVEAAVNEVGADSLKQMGAVIKAARARLEGKTIDGKALSDRVRERLNDKS